MDPITLSVLSGVLFYVIDKKRKAKDARAPSLETFTLPTIGASEVNSFSHVTGPEQTRQFNRVVSDGLPALLGARGLVPIPTGPIARVSAEAQVYRVVPLQQGLLRASEVIADARREGKTVLASLSIIGVTWGMGGAGADEAMLVVTGGDELRTLVASPPGVRGDFALLPPRVEPIIAAAEVKEEAPAVAVPAQVEEAAPPNKKAQKPNGLPREAPPAIVTTSAEVKSET